MRRIESYVEGAHAIADAQLSILEAARKMLTEDELAQVENNILEGGLNNWEAKLLGVIKVRVADNFKRVNIPKPSPVVVIADPAKPRLRKIVCSRCQAEFNFAEPGGGCCHGHGPCPSCRFEIHEPKCPTRAPRAE